MRLPPDPARAYGEDACMADATSRRRLRKLQEGDPSARLRTMLSCTLVCKFDACMQYHV